MVEQPSCSQVAHCTIFSNDSLSDASGDTSVWRTLPGRKESLDPQDPVSKCRLRKKGIAAIPSTRTEIVLHIHLWCTVHGSRPGHGYRTTHVWQMHSVIVCFIVGIKILAPDAAGSADRENPWLKRNERLPWWRKNVYTYIYTCISCTRLYYTYTYTYIYISYLYMYIYEYVYVCMYTMYSLILHLYMYISYLYTYIYTPIIRCTYKYTIYIYPVYIPKNCSSIETTGTAVPKLLHCSHLMAAEILRMYSWDSCGQWWHQGDIVLLGSN